jgi:hypothetical protein
MIREIRRHGFRKGVRVWFTWAAVEDIEELSATTRRRRAAYELLRLGLIFD